MATIFRGGSFFTPASQGRIQTGEPAFAECIVVQDGIITYVGASDGPEVIQAQDSGALVKDVGQRIVLPSFIDGHMHLLMMGQSLKKVNLEACKNLEDIRTTIKSYAQAHPGVPRILCRGWMHPMTDGKALASMLDYLDPRPIFIDSKDLHSSWCNGAALDELGAHDLPNTKGGCTVS